MFCKVTETTDSIMTKEDFTKTILEPRLKKTRELLTSKGDEYAATNNVFHNFIKGAAIDKITPERCLWDYMRKHLVSVQDMIEDSENFSMPQISEKIGDIICYLILLEALFSEQFYDLWKQLITLKQNEQNS